MNSEDTDRIDVMIQVCLSSKPATYQSMIDRAYLFNCSKLATLSCFC